MPRPDDQRTEVAHLILSDAVFDLCEEAGLDSEIAAYRFLSWQSAQRIADGLSPEDARADIERLRGMLDQLLAEIPASAH